MRHDYNTPDDALIACGTTANKKIGKVWVCDYHFAAFQHVADDIGESASLLNRISDCRDAKRDE